MPHLSVACPFLPSRVAMLASTPQIVVAHQSSRTRLVSLSFCNSVDNRGELNDSSGKCVNRHSSQVRQPACCRHTCMAASP